MRIFINFVLFLIICLIPTLIATSCENEDDISLIFEGKTWKITGGMINGNELNGEELRSLYTASNTFFLVFNTYGFSGVLAEGSEISGTWKANGKNRQLTINITEAKGAESTTLSYNIYKVLSQATSYSGDQNILCLRQDKYNYIRITSLSQSY